MEAYAGQEVVSQQSVKTDSPYNLYGREGSPKGSSCFPDEESSHGGKYSYEFSIQWIQRIRNVENHEDGSSNGLGFPEKHIMSGEVTMAT